jgi:hypothetical protein
MALATATAISAGLSLAGAGANFAQAAKQNKLMRQAQEEAAKYLDEAKQKIEINYMEQLQVPLEGYEAASKMNLAAGMQATNALRETDQRAVLGGTGRILEQSNRASEAMRLGMQEELYERDRAIAEEDQRIAQQLAGLDLETARGAQMAAAESDINRANAITGAISGLTQAGSTLYEGSALYGTSQGDKMGQSIGPIGSLNEESVGRIAANQNLNAFQKANLAKKGQSSRFFDKSAFDYFDPNGIIAPELTGGFSYPVLPPPVNPFNRG